MQAIDGSTTRRIAAVHRIETGPPRTGLGERRVVVLFPFARPLHGNSSGGKAAICPATAPQAA
ncbi:MAG: hypothetical protein WBW31_24555 [Candidatus Sulfotelmatobacter sp.]